MSDFKRILVAIDLDASADQVLEQAATLASDAHSEVTVLHVGYSAIPMYGGFMGEGAYIPNNVMEEDKEYYDQAKQKLTARVNELGLSDAEVLIEFGRTVDVILEVADRQRTDLIVLGSHGRHGVGLLLGSTANGVLHRAKCDVLAVRIKD